MSAARPSTTGLRQFLNDKQQRDWLEGRAELSEVSYSLAGYMLGDEGR